MGVNLKQIATISGFSLSTVSKALNDHHEISEKTKEKIRKVAKKHHYIRNHQAVALRSKKCGVIVALMPKNSISKYATLLEGLEYNAQNNGYKLLLQQYNNSKLRDADFFNSLSGFSDGMVLFGEKESQNNIELKLKLQDQLLSDTKMPYITCFNAEEDLNKKSANRKIGQDLYQKLITRINQ